MGCHRASLKVVGAGEPCHDLVLVHVVGGRFSKPGCQGRAHAIQSNVQVVVDVHVALRDKISHPAESHVAGGVNGQAVGAGRVWV